MLDFVRAFFKMEPEDVDETITTTTSSSTEDKQSSEDEDDCLCFIMINKRGGIKRLYRTSLRVDTTGSCIRSRKQSRPKRVYILRE